MDLIHLLHWIRSSLVNTVLISVVVLKQLNVSVDAVWLGNGLKDHHWLLLC